MNARLHEKVEGVEPLLKPGYVKIQKNVCGQLTGRTQNTRFPMAWKFSGVKPSNPSTGELGAAPALD